ncbi:MAG: NAD(P)-dependent alcohol dehydrogenase [Phycisphaerae bacterium]|jgi:NADPH:quinone reductase-like Zn-dependent oxidoreductase
MRVWRLSAFGLENLRLEDHPAPTPGPGEVLLEVQALSLNYRDLLVVRGQYNPKLRLPAVPISDGAGKVAAVGTGVARVRVGELVMGQFITGWTDGPFSAEHPKTTLGLPGPGLAAERVVLPEAACVRPPAGYDAAQAATLPIAALTAWSALVTEGRVQPGQTVLTLGTGGVSIFAVQIAKALGATVIVTSSSDEKLSRARALGADHGINYRTTEDWPAAVLERTGGRGVDLTVETVGAATLEKSLLCTRPGGIVALLGALQGIKGELNVGLILMKRLRVLGIMVDSRRAFEEMNTFLARHGIRPVIDRTFGFTELPAALRAMERGEHFGKLVVRVA